MESVRAVEDLDAIGITVRLSALLFRRLKKVSHGIRVRLVNEPTPADKLIATP